MNVLIRIKRISAYMLDNIISFILFQIIITVFHILLRIIKASISIDNQIFVIIINIVSIVFVFLYYRYFWIQSGYYATPAQMLCQIKIKVKPNLRQCIQRIIFMHVGGLYITIAAIYMYISKMEQYVGNKFLLITISSAIVMQLIYGFYIDRVDKITGIEIVDREI